MVKIFFTDITTNFSSYCLLNIKQYNNPNKFSKKLIYIDPGVYELKKSQEYSKIDFMHNLIQQNLLQKNEYISIDYPPDMNLKYSSLFIQKSIKNNLKYKNNEQYICTIQSRFQDFKDFKKQFEFLESHINFDKKIIGIGNLCRIFHPNKFTDNLFSYLATKKYKYHFYGLGLNLIKKYLRKLENWSIDNTKWTRAVNSELKSKYGLNCTNKTRDLYFLTYIKQIKKIYPDLLF